MYARILDQGFMYIHTCTIIYVCMYIYIYVIYTHMYSYFTYLLMIASIWL